jgi:glutamine---fructose-6-phosphate transaminase (isomerizing)
MTLYSEIYEQPARLAHLLSAQKQTVDQIAKKIQERNVSYAFLAARGTSDNAGRYANYLWGAMNGLPVALATPSIFTYYQQPPHLKNALVVGISQSGQSPDIVSVIQEGKRQNCLTLAITNDPSSPMAQSADFVLDILAGPELAVAATKTYTAELMAISMLSAALSHSTQCWETLAQVPAWIDQVLQQDQAIQQMVERFRYMQRCVVVGRGYNYATVFEWALKLKELTYIEAEPYSSADFQHGPIAMIEKGFPVMAVAPQGKVCDSLIDLFKELKKNFLVELVMISNSQEALKLAQSPISIPGEIPEWVTPLVSIVPGQIFANYLTRLKGLDPEKPRSIHKITETR